MGSQGSMVRPRAAAAARPALPRPQEMEASRVALADSAPAIVSAPLGVSLQGNVESPGDILWYSFEATANRERARPCTRSLCRLMPQPLGRFHAAHRAGLRSRSSCLLAQMRT